MDQPILVVEDERLVALDLAHKLGQLGYADVVFSTSGPEAVEKADESRPSLVLMDIGLEGTMDGIEAAFLIESKLHVPIIFVTAKGDDETTLRASQLLSASLVRFVIKPVSREALGAAMRSALNRTS